MTKTKVKTDGVVCNIMLQQEKRCVQGKCPVLSVPF